MVRVIEFDLLPILELVKRREVVFETSFFGVIGRLDRELENECVRLLHRLPHLRIIRHALVAHHLEERIGRADAHAADIVGRMARMNTGSAVEGLRDGARGLHCGDCH